MIILLIYGSNLSPLIALLIAIKSYIKGKRLDRISISVLALVTISFTADLSSYFFALVFGSNYWIINCYFILEIALTGFLFGFILNHKIIITLYILISLGFATLNTVVGFHYYHGEFLAISGLLSIIMCCLSLNSLYQNESNLYIENVPTFWYVVGLLTYFSGALFSFILSSDILKQQHLHFEYSWAFHNIANILKNLLFAIGLWKVRAAV